jgi:hypothetical protein
LNHLKKIFTSNRWKLTKYSSIVYSASPIFQRTFTQKICFPTQKKVHSFTSRVMYTRFFLLFFLVKHTFILGKQNSGIIRQPTIHVFLLLFLCIARLIKQHWGVHTPIVYLNYFLLYSTSPINKLIEVSEHHLIIDDRLYWDGKIIYRQYLVQIYEVYTELVPFYIHLLIYHLAYRN